MSLLPIFESVFLKNFFDDLLADLECAAISLPDGQAVSVQPRDPSDIATLSAMSRQCQQYLNLKPDELAICNDPYSGGTQLSDISLITAFGEHGKSSTEFLLIYRLRFPAGLFQSGKLQDEGLRIPPTPLGTLVAPNLDILGAIASHPDAPMNLASRVKQAIQVLSQKKETLEQALKDEQNKFKRVFLKNYFSDCTATFRKQIGKLALGESRWSTRLSCGALLKLRLLVHDEKILFDFSGSEESAYINLTELATFGICFNAIKTALGHSVPANAGTFELLQVSAPSKTLLNAKFPAGTWQGMNIGLYEVSDFIYNALLKLNPHLAHSTDGGPSGYIQIKFKNGLTFFDSLASGQGAKFNAPGLAATSQWLAHEFTQKSLAFIEQELPLQILKSGATQDSAGGGRYPGGSGLQRTYRLLQDARVSWSFIQTESIPLEGGEPGKPAKLALKSETSELETLALSGHRDLKLGDELHVSTAGGAGYASRDKSSDPDENY